MLSKDWLYSARLEFYWLGRRGKALVVAQCLFILVVRVLDITARGFRTEGHGRVEIGSDGRLGTALQILLEARGYLEHKPQFTIAQAAVHFVIVLDRRLFLVIIRTAKGVG